MDVRLKRIKEIETWLKGEYIQRLETIRRYKYLGIKPPESEYSLQVEAYNKEQELRAIKGLDPLPDIKNTFII